MNPWETIPYSDYELHMKDDSVMQLQELSNLMKRKLNEYRPESILVLGCAGGNGFENIDDSITKKVIGIDINNKYLEICRNKFDSKSFDLELICCDIDKTKLQIAKVDYISCALFLEYVDWRKAVEQIKTIMNTNSVFNIVIQRNNNNKFVSKTGIESLNALSSVSETVAEEELENYMSNSKMKLIKKDYIDLPNGKEFIIFDYKL